MRMTVPWCVSPHALTIFWTSALRFRVYSLPLSCTHNSCYHWNACYHSNFARSTQSTISRPPSIDIRLNFLKKRVCSFQRTLTGSFPHSINLVLCNWYDFGRRGREEGVEPVPDGSSSSESFSTIPAVVWLLPLYHHTLQDGNLPPHPHLSQDTLTLLCPCTCPRPEKNNASFGEKGRASVDFPPPSQRKIV